MTPMTPSPTPKPHILPALQITDHGFAGFKGEPSGLCMLCGGPVGQHKYHSGIFLVPTPFFVLKTLPDGTKVVQSAAVPRPVQEPLFILPGPPRATRWAIYYRWRVGERSLLTGELLPTEWQVDSTYKCLRVAKNSLRSLRYRQGRRKEFRFAVYSIEHDGDIECTVPHPAAPGESGLPKVTSDSYPY